MSTMSQTYGGSSRVETSTQSFALLKFSASSPTPLSAGEADAQWTHHSQPGLLLIVTESRAQNMILRVNLRVIWDDSSTEQVHMLLPDIDLASFKPSVDCPVPLKSMYQGAVIGFRYRAVEQEGAVFRRIQVRLAREDDMTRLLALLEPVCPCKSVAPTAVPGSSQSQKRPARAAAARAKALHIPSTPTKRPRATVKQSGGKTKAVEAFSQSSGHFSDSPSWPRATQEVSPVFPPAIDSELPPPFAIPHHAGPPVSTPFNETQRSIYNLSSDELWSYAVDLCRGEEKEDFVNLCLRLEQAWKTRQ